MSHWDAVCLLIWYEMINFCSGEVSTQVFISEHALAFKSINKSVSILSCNQRVRQSL